jgi:predicted acylesterase/phospholipase RssA
MTRTGLLEYHYERYLYGDTSLFELPDRPELHILATNLSEGCLCSFNRNGLMMMHRQRGNGVRLERIHVGLATVPMAVTASSAFPGFFPPAQLSGADVGASGGEFGTQAYTDGGVFDNLGIRLFRCLERPVLAESNYTESLSSQDFSRLTPMQPTSCKSAAVETAYWRRGTKRGSTGIYSKPHSGMPRAVPAFADSTARWTASSSVMWGSGSRFRLMAAPAG